jgi:hypothetical protein
MNEVRPRMRARRGVEGRAREIQGVFCMPGLEEEPDPESKATEAGRIGAVSVAPEVKPLPYRVVVAGWPEPWRERWGRRANELEEDGLSWRDAEGRAFVEVWGQLRAAEGVERN